jgi:hypothetical protein
VSTALEVEQVLLAFQAAAVAGEVTRGSDDAVAGHDDADRVASVGQADRPGGAGASDPLGELAVGPCFAVRDLPQSGPHDALKRGADEIERQVELGALPTEILIQLPDHPGERSGVRLAERRFWRPVPLQVHIQAGEDAVERYQGKRTDWTVLHTVN